MKVEPKLSWLWVLAVPCVIAGSVWWYMSTNAIRQYKYQNYERKLISERQALDIKLYHQGVELAEIQKDIQEYRGAANAPGQNAVAQPQVQ